MLADLFSASPFSRRGACRLSVALLTAALVAFVGCDPPKPSRPSGASRTGATSGTGGATAAGKVVIPDGVSSSSPAGPATETARELLGRLAATYRAASTYSDEGRLVMWSVSGTKSSSDVIAPFVCQYARPNKFRLTCYDAEASCDGREFLARIGAYPDQMLRKDAPAAITPDELLGDPMFAQSMAGRLGVLNPLIGLLFDPEAAKALVFEAGEPKFDSPGVFETHNCWRVRQPTGAGDLVYWIDQQDTILRRIELPTDDVKPQLDPGYRLAQLALTVDFNKAAFGAKIPPDRFTLGISQDVALVNRFLDLQPPDAPSPWLGKPVPDVRIKASNGQETTLAAFRGKTLVIEVWATWCPWCVQSLPLVDKAFSKFRENSSVQFLA
ncbi:MAG TPA: TlpA disulfide reductase family protein, partial [Pirellulales bacterium]